MTDYISREAAIEAMFKDAEAHPGHIFWVTQHEALRNIPAADVRLVVRGRWKLGGYGQISDATEKWYDQFLCGGFLYCSVCKGRTSVKFNFCPNCGADMRPTSMSGANGEGNHENRTE